MGTASGYILHEVKTVRYQFVDVDTDSIWFNNLTVFVIHIIMLPRGTIYHYDDVIMSAIASQITSLTIVYSTVYPGADESKLQSSVSLAFV